LKRCSTLSSDKEFLAEIRGINNSRDMLQYIVDNVTFLGGDSYYSYFRNAMIDQAQKILDELNEVGNYE
jgi:hypothetical protein